jgi:hypothetical protein
VILNNSPNAFRDLDVWPADAAEDAFQDGR